MFVSGAVHQTFAEKAEIEKRGLYKVDTMLKSEDSSGAVKTTLIIYKCDLFSTPPTERNKHKTNKNIR